MPYDVCIWMWMKKQMDEWQNGKENGKEWKWIGMSKWKWIIRLLAALIGINST